MFVKHLGKILKILLSVIIATIFLSKTLFAGSAGPASFSWGFLIVGLFGGLAFFLFGMEMMSDGMKKSAGSKMRAILAALTKNRVIALLVGAFVTMVIQSSSATTVMLVSFVQAELMGFTQAIGVILGANIGTTITAQLIAFKLTDYALLIIIIGFTMRMFAKSDNIKFAGEAILGFGILFFGMKLMGDSMKPLRAYQGFIDVMKGLENPLLALLVGTVFTGLIQSSSAFTGIVIVLAQQQMITLEAGIPMILGANIGTCITAGLASIGTARDSKRVAIAHVIFNFCGAIIFIFWIPAFADIIRVIAAKFNSDTARQIANAHTLFNVSLALIFLPFTSFFARLVLKILPDKVEEKSIEPVTRHLDKSMISTPVLAIDSARSEISRMAKILGRMLDAIIVPFTSKELWPDERYPQLSLLETIEVRVEKLDFLEERIVDYLFQITRQELSEEQVSEVYGMISIVKDMESIGDIIHNKMIPMIDRKKALDKDFSQEGKKELMTYHENVCKQIHRLEHTFAEMDPTMARKVVLMEEKYLEFLSQYRSELLTRLTKEQRQPMKTHLVYWDLMDLMKQINVFTDNIAKTILASIVQE
ncbi:Na/Pi cotransporter family protein [Thermodesulfobacteriota bacterium]